jgi:hypothetical protein
VQPRTTPYGSSTSAITPAFKPKLLPHRSSANALTPAFKPELLILSTDGALALILFHYRTHNIIDADAVIYKTASDEKAEFIIDTNLFYFFMRQQALKKPASRGKN